MPFHLNFIVCFPDLIEPFLAYFIILSNCINYYCGQLDNKNRNLVRIKYKNARITLRGQFLCVKEFASCKNYLT